MAASGRRRIVPMLLVDIAGSTAIGDSPFGKARATPTSVTDWHGPVGLGNRN